MIAYPNPPTTFFPETGEGDFELFPFRTYLGDNDWDWVNGYQMDIDGNLYDYGDAGDNPDVYIRQSTEHVQHGTYSAEFHLGEGTEGTHGGSSKHCKLYQRDQVDYPDSYLHPTDGQPEAYYSAWYWFPSDFGERVEDWRLIMQWAEEDGGNHLWLSGAQACFPSLALIFSGGGSKELSLCNNRFYLEYDPDGTSKYVRWGTGVTAYTIPKEQWVHIEVFVKMSSGFLEVDGKAIVWINDQKVVEENIGLWNYWTEPEDNGVCWGIGSYGTKENTGSIWIDNVQVTNTY